MARMEFISAVSLINERVETSNERQYCIVFYTAVIARRIKISQTSGMIKIDNEAARLFQYEKKIAMEYDESGEIFFLCVHRCRLDVINGEKDFAEAYVFSCFPFNWYFIAFWLDNEVKLAYNRSSSWQANTIVRGRVFRSFKWMRKTIKLLEF